MGFDGIGFFPTSNKPRTSRVRGYSLELLHTAQCAACPLNQQSGFTPSTPHMAPSGSATPTIYMLGEAPGEHEDARGVPFVGNAGQYLRSSLPPHWARKMRWSNVVRTRPKGNADPDDQSIECCRPSVVADIEASKPQAIFGFGGIALRWALKRGGISQWNGRRIPLRVGNHTCWYFPMYHPSYILHMEGAGHGSPTLRKQYESVRFVFELDLQRAFAALEAGLPEPVPHTRDMALDGTRILETVTQIDNALRALARDKVIGIDLETQGTRPYEADARILSIALAGANCSYTFGIDHPGCDWSAKQRDAIADMLRDFLTNASCRKVQFTGFEMEWLAHWLGNDVLWSRWADAQGQAYLLDARQGTLSLEFLCLQHFGIDIKALSNVDRNRLIDTDLETVLHYNGCDARYHRALYLHQSQLIKTAGLADVWAHHNRRIAAVVATQLKGIPVNPATVADMHTDYSGIMTDIEADIAALPVVKKFNSNNGARFRPSANKDVMTALHSIGAHLNKVEAEDLEGVDHPLAKALLSWRAVAKMHSTYISPLLPDSSNSALMPDGLIHPTLLVNRVRTWRSSSEDPNSQNYPKHGTWEGLGQTRQRNDVRRQIEAPPGQVIAAFDFGQIQARNVAQESDDEALVASMWKRHDIHADWRDRIFKIYPRWAKEGLATVLADKALLKKYRQEAKNGFVFASFFGAGGKKVAEHLGVPEQIGYQLAEEFDDAFPGVARWQAGLHRFYAEHGYITGLTGFRRYAPVAHTEIINTPIQSDESMIVFDAMMRLAETGEPHYAANILIHDDLTYVWPKNKLDEYAEYVIGEMLNCSLPWAHKVPIVVEMSVGKTWDKLQECGSYESDKWHGGETYKPASGK